MKIELFFLALTVFSQFARAELAVMPKLPVNGWASYDVASVSGAANWCCFSVRQGQVACDLDKPDQGFVSSRDELAAVTVRLIRIFVQMQNGQVQSLRPVGLSCPVTSSQPVRHFGQVSTSVSLAWLAPISAKPKRMDATLATIAAHDSAQADQALRDFLAPTQNLKLRKAALFWAGQMRATAGFELAQAAMQDSSADYRAHALFVIAQSKETRRANALVQAGQSDKSPQVRGQAWFWLANTSDKQTVNAAASIRMAVLNDTDDHVREQAIFALSQLPSGQAIKALTGLLDERKLPRTVRERALFWLTQSDDPLALQYLDRVLSK